MSSLVDVDKQNDQLLEDELADLLNEETQNPSNKEKYHIPGTFLATCCVFTQSSFLLAAILGSNSPFTSVLCFPLQF